MAGHAPRRNAVRTDLATCLEGRPESKKWPERKRKEDSVAPLYLRALVDGLPALEHPLPAVVRVEPPQRASGRGRCLVVTGVRVERLAEVRPPRRRRLLVRDQFALCRERQL